MGPASGRDSHRGKDTVRLVGSLRGEGRLAWGAREDTVGYQLDVYAGRSRVTGSGSLDGPLQALAGSGVRVGVLRLADGTEVEVALSDVDREGAMFESRGPLPTGLAA